MSSNLTAMRELANSSARTAIETHSKDRHLETAFSKLLISSIATGLAAYMLFTAEDLFSLASLGGWVAATIGVIWGFGTLKVLLEAVRAGSHQQHTPEEISTDEQPLPIDVPESNSNEG